MGKFSNVCFASDFDHTLTGLDNRVRQNNIDAIRYFMEEGGVFTVASGRSIPMFRGRSGLVPVNAPCILYNGAACYDFRSGQLHFLHPMDDVVCRLVKAARAFDPELYVEVQGVDTHYVLDGGTFRDQFLRAEGVEPVHCNLSQVPQPWMKVTVCSVGGYVLDTADKVSPEEHAKVAALVARLTEVAEGRCYVTRSLSRVVEIGPVGCGKGQAARDLANQFGRKILACAGDAPNDLTMLREADFAFTPAEHDPGLSGDFIETCVCDEGCVADAIARLERLL